MNYIIFDLEATCWNGTPPSDTQEVIEIGAILLNDYGEDIGSYNRFIRPIVHPTLSVYCKELTTIQQQDVNRAKTFPDVIEEFQDWGQMYHEDYLLCSWGNFDHKILVRNCDLHDMDSEWVDKHINIKAQYQQMKGIHRPYGLRRAVEREGFEFTGIHHRGISDAENLAKIFAKYIDEWIC